MNKLLTMLLITAFCYASQEDQSTIFVRLPVTQDVQINHVRCCSKCLADMLGLEEFDFYMIVDEKECQFCETK